MTWLVPSPFPISRAMSNYEEEEEEEEEQPVSRQTVEIVCHDDPRTSECRVLGVKEIIHQHHPGRGMAALPLPPTTMDFPPPSIHPRLSKTRRAPVDGNDPSSSGRIGRSVEEAWKRGSPRWPSPRAGFYTAQLSASVDKSR